jgi:hypothetical protein
VNLLHSDDDELDWHPYRTPEEIAAYDARQEAEMKPLREASAAQKIMDDARLRKWRAAAGRCQECGSTEGREHPPFGDDALTMQVTAAFIAPNGRRFSVRLAHGAVISGDAGMPEIALEVAKMTGGSLRRLMLSFVKSILFSASSGWESPTYGAEHVTGQARVEINELSHVLHNAFGREPPVWPSGLTPGDFVVPK